MGIFLELGAHELLSGILSDRSRHLQEIFCGWAMVWCKGGSWRELRGSGAEGEPLMLAFEKYCPDDYLRLEQRAR
jgi:hypothetical protein